MYFYMQRVHKVSECCCGMSKESDCVYFNATVLPLRLTDFDGFASTHLQCTI